jgi:hypothetical protein
MKTQLLDSPAKRVPIALAVLTVVVVVGAAIYTFSRSAPSQPVNAPKIIAAARTYSHSLRDGHQPVPHSIPLQKLVDQGLLLPADLGPFQGMEANIFLTSDPGDPPVLMRVHMTDGTDIILMANGQMLQVKR